MRITAGLIGASTHLLPPGGGGVRASESSAAAAGRRDGARVEAVPDADERTAARRTGGAERVQRLDESGLRPGPGRNAVATYLAVARSTVMDAAAAELAGIDVIV